jgi:hypothetical protein
VLVQSEDNKNKEGKYLFLFFDGQIKKRGNASLRHIKAKEWEQEMQFRTGDDDDLPLEQKVANERHWENVKVERMELKTVEAALQAFRGIRADSRIAVLQVYRSIKNRHVLNETLYELLISKSVLDFRILYTLNMIATAKKIRTAKLCEEVGKGLCKCSGSRFLDLEPEIVRAIVHLARL